MSKKKKHYLVKRVGKVELSDGIERNEKKRVDHNNSNSERNYSIGIFIELYSIDWNWIYKTNLIVLIRLVIKLTWVFFLYPQWV